MEEIWALALGEGEDQCWAFRGLNWQGWEVPRADEMGLLCPPVSVSCCGLSRWQLLGVCRESLPVTVLQALQWAPISPATEVLLDLVLDALSDLSYFSPFPQPFRCTGFLAGPRTMNA